MNSRDSILSALRSVEIDKIRYPGAFKKGFQYDDLTNKFEESVGLAAGTMVSCTDLKDCTSKIENHELFKEAKKMANTHSEIAFSLQDHQTLIEVNEDQNY